MRPELFVVACVFLAGCTGVSSVRYDAATNPVGTPYYLPKGVVPVEVFIDPAKGIAVSVADAELVTDNQVGMLVAQTHPSPLNDEDMKIGVDHDTSFLKSVSSESTAQLPAIAAEAAKLAGRLTLQNAKINFFTDRTKVLSDRFDPLDPADVARVNASINGALARASQVDRSGGALPQFALSLDSPTGAFGAPAAAPVAAPNCRLGICVRMLTTRVLYITADGAELDTKVLRLPSREIITVPVPQTVLADQKIHLALKDGMLTDSEIDRKSEALGFVKTLGAIPGAVMQGMFSALDDKKTAIDKTKDVVTSETELRKAQKTAAETSISLQNAPFASAQNAKPYEATLVTVYPFRGALAKAVRLQNARAMAPPPPPRDPREDGFTDKPKTEEPKTDGPRN